MTKRITFQENMCKSGIAYHEPLIVKWKIIRNGISLLIKNSVMRKISNKTEETVYSDRTY
uniref:Transposase n=1 Tax=Heterorhabditis bacteriophora TaxID=37862 RepID=A0A1I7X3V0_HETBA